ncbi:MAG: carboxypeptidase-like regulatory domain-containing protein [Ignavibacteriales bacterium]|nr:carboxypeptidase-like regulatory domain-containing protein [Ignavibacteriales bacterium]
MIKKLPLNFFYLFLIIISTSSIRLSQTAELTSISGRVIDSITKEGLPGVSVYLSGTTTGTSSDKSGNYKIAKLPIGHFIIVVSMVGYKPIHQNIEIHESSIIQKNFSLENQPIELNAITVSLQSDEYAAYLKKQKEYKEIFKKYFLGRTDFSDECQIENIDDITFTEKYEPYVNAVCSKPIVVINNALGYKVACLLIHFLCNDTRGELNYEFNPRFTEMAPINDDQKEKWIENRKLAFKSSLSRFLLYLMHAKGIGWDYSTNSYNAKINNEYKLVNPGEKFFYMDSESGLFYLKFRDFLYVKNLLTDEQSFIPVPSGFSYLDPGGYAIDPMSIQVAGEFAKHGVADLLPMDISYLEWLE